jgi:hypothetical protein
MGEMSNSWPSAEPDRISRLHVLAAMTPGAVVVETVLPHSFEEVWAVASDFERELPRCLVDVRSFTITRADGERLEADARGYLGLRARFEIILRPGWCVMRSRFLLGAMAAEPAATGIRFAFLGGFRFPGIRPVGPLLHLVGRPALRQVVSRYAERVLARSGESDRPAHS